MGNLVVTTKYLLTESEVCMGNIKLLKVLLYMYLPPSNREENACNKAEV